VRTKQCHDFEVTSLVPPADVHCTRRDPPEEPRDRYTRSIHWACQVESTTHAWTPEIYESVTIPITVIRIITGERPLDDPQCLHFDFEVKTTLRCLGVGVCGPPFTNPSKPADRRIKDDTGEPLMPDYYSFCVFCSVTEDQLPTHRTLDIGEAARRYLREVKLVP